jgi:HEXXH motif-containing protein
MRQEQTSQSVATADASLLSGFSSPSLPFSNSFLSSIVTNYAHSLFELAAEAFAGQFKSDLSPLSPLSELRASPETFEMLWSPALGSLFQALATNDVRRALRSTVAISLQAAAAGVPMAWRIDLNDEIQFLWGTSFLLPPCETISLESSGDKAVLRLNSGGMPQLVRLFKDDADLWAGEGGQVLRCISGERGSIAVLGRETAVKGLLDQFECQLVADSDLDIAFLQRVLDRLRHELPPYGTWISRVIRWLLIADAGTERYLKSGSSQYHHGLAYISNLDTFVDVAEMLIHEASHQYYYSLSHLDALVDPTDEHTYYSPFAGTMRDLGRIVLAYHAFANVYLFYQSCLELGDTTVIGRASRTLSDLKAIEPYILNNSSLTSLGRLLVDPLVTRLDNV